MGLFTVFHNHSTLEKRKRKSSPRSAMRFIVFGSVEATNIHKAKEHVYWLPKSSQYISVDTSVVLINYNSCECTPSSSAWAQAKRKKKKGWQTHTQLGNYFLNINQWGEPVGDDQARFYSFIFFSFFSFWGWVRSVGLLFFFLCVMMFMYVG
jgi:hypothetical protein